MLCEVKINPRMSVLGTVMKSKGKNFLIETNNGMEWHHVSKITFQNRCLLCGMPISYEITKREFCFECTQKHWEALEMLRYILRKVIKVRRVKI